MSFTMTCRIIERLEAALMQRDVMECVGVASSVIPLTRTCLQGTGGIRNHPRHGQLPAITATDSQYIMLTDPRNHHAT